MHYLIVAIYFLFSLIGCDDIGAHNIVTHATDRGVEMLYSEASITPLRARFWCRDSVTGKCHYRVFIAQCGNPSVHAHGPTCERNFLHALVLGAGQRDKLAGLPVGFSFCVDQVALPLDSPCQSEQSSGFSL